MLIIIIPDSPTSLSLIILDGFCGRKAPCFLPSKAFRTCMCMRSKAGCLKSLTAASKGVDCEAMRALCFAKAYCTLAVIQDTAASFGARRDSRGRAPDTRYQRLYSHTHTSNTRTQQFNARCSIIIKIAKLRHARTNCQNGFVQRVLGLRR